MTHHQNNRHHGKKQEERKDLVDRLIRKANKAYKARRRQLGEADYQFA